MGYDVFCRLVHKGAVVTLVIFGVKFSGLIVIIFAHDVATILLLNI